MDANSENNEEVKPVFTLHPADLSLADLQEGEVWNDDVLNRSEEAKAILSIISSQPGPLTLCLNAKWGEGKTFILRRMKRQYEIDGGMAIYFNAWEDDNLDDPLIALIGQLKSEFKDKVAAGWLKEFLECVVPLLKGNLASIGWGILRKFVPGGKIFMPEDIKDLGKTTEASAFDEYENLTALRNALRQKLEELAAAVVGGSKKPLLFIVDELDRCRPTFAVETLERIKHLFGVKNVVFLLGADCEQLKHCIRAVYGDIDADNYLHRFVDIELGLEKPNAGVFFSYALARHCNDQYLEYICKEKGAPVAYYQDRRYQFEAFASMIAAEGFSLREIEKIVRHYALLSASKSSNIIARTYFLPLMLILRMRHKELYGKFIDGKVTPAEILDAIYERRDEELFDRGRFFGVVQYVYKAFTWSDVCGDLSKELQSDFKVISEDTTGVFPKGYDRHLAACVKRKGRTFICQLAKAVNQMHGSFGDLLDNLREIASAINCVKEVY